MKESSGTYPSGRPSMMIERGSSTRVGSKARRTSVSELSQLDPDLRV